MAKKAKKKKKGTFEVVKYQRDGKTDARCRNPTTKQYEKSTSVCKTNIMVMFYHITGSDDKETLESLKNGLTGVPCFTFVYPIWSGRKLPFLLQLTIAGTLPQILIENMIIKTNKAY